MKVVFVYFLRKKNYFLCHLALLHANFFDKVFFVRIIVLLYRIGGFCLSGKLRYSLILITKLSSLKVNFLSLAFCL